MSDMTIKPAAAKWRKLTLQLFLGALVGGGSMMAILTLTGKAMLQDMGGSRVALAGVGLIYLLIGAMVGFGAAAPKAGAKLLNVDDADELREQRGTLSLSLIIMVAIGGALIVLALARAPGMPGGVIEPLIAFALLVVALAGSSLLGWLADARYDELDRQLSLEGMSYGFSFTLLVLTLWAAAAHLGLGVRLLPVDVISLLAAMLLLGLFWAVGRRGMMTR